MTERTSTLKTIQTKYSPISKTVTSASLATTNPSVKTSTNQTSNVNSILRSNSSLNKKPSIFSQIGETVTSGLENIQSGISSAGKTVTDGLSTVSSEVSSGVSSATETVSPVAKTLTKDLTSTVESTVKSTVKAVEDSSFIQRFMILFIIPIQKHGFSVILTMSIILGVILVYREFSKYYPEQQTKKTRIGEIVYENFVGDSDETRIDYKQDLMMKDNQTTTTIVDSMKKKNESDEPIKKVTLIENDPNNNTNDQTKDNESSKPSEITPEEENDDESNSTEEDKDKQKQIENDIAEFDKLVRKGFCDNFTEEGGDKLEEACMKLSSDSCDVVGCCARLSNNKCVAANENGPLYTTGPDGKPLDLDYYYYKGECVGKCEK